MKRVMFAVVLVGQGLFAGQALAAACAGSTLDPSCASAALVYTDPLPAPRAPQAVTPSVASAFPVTVDVARDTPLTVVAIPSSASSARVLDTVAFDSPIAPSLPSNVKTIAGYTVPAQTGLASPVLITDIPESAPAPAPRFDAPSAATSSVITAIPEPASILLLAAGLAGFALIRRSSLPRALAASRSRSLRGAATA